MELCAAGKRIALREHNICVKANGDCTALYWHISDCEECWLLRNKERIEAK